MTGETVIGIHYPDATTPDAMIVDIEITKEETLLREIGNAIKKTDTVTTETVAIKEIGSQEEEVDREASIETSDFYRTLIHLDREVEVDRESELTKDTLRRRERDINIIARKETGEAKRKMLQKRS